MIYTYQDTPYEVEVVRKNNKNTYIRIKNNKVYITTNYFTTKRTITKLLTDNKTSIDKMIKTTIIKEKKKEEFLIFGRAYNIIYNPNIKEIIIKEDTLETPNDKTLNIWLNNIIKNIYQEKLTFWYEKFQEPIPNPNLKIRKMKTRWGVCNTKNHNVTLNYELYRYDIDCLEYVIIHELSHFLEPNHSKNFWRIVEKYCPNYKEIKNKLKT